MPFLNSQVVLFAAPQILRPTNCGSLIPRQSTSKAQETAWSSLHAFLAALADRPCGLDFTCVGRIYAVYRIALVSFCTFSYPLQIRAPALHSSPSWFTLDFIISTSPCRPVPSSPSRSMSPTSHPFSKISVLLLLLHRRAGLSPARLHPVFSDIIPFLHSHFVGAFVLRSHI